MGVIDQYWTGVLQRLQAEVEVFNRLIAHLLNGVQDDDHLVGFRR
jgi:hypothetical protein